MHDKTTDEILPVVLGLLFLLGMIVAVGWLTNTVSAAPTYDAEAEYQRALVATLRPDRTPVAQDLYKFDRTTTFVTWTKAEYVHFFQGDNAQPCQDVAQCKGAKAGKDIWVTDADSLKRFCKDFAKEHGSDADALALRLKQRLGLPPDSANDTFVELLVDPAKELQTNPQIEKHIFRPCGNMSDQLLNQNTCNAPGQLPGEDNVWGDNKKVSTSEQEWILRKYYATFSSAPPNSQYPWTALGYTFDWARNEDGSDKFVGEGQSEFVIPTGDPVYFKSATPTAAYCAP